MFLPLLFSGDATLVLNGVILQDNGPVDPNPLRGIHAGDIWAPPIKGSNILRCGSWGTESYWGAYRGDLYPGQTFSVNGSIPVPNGGGWLSFSVLEGEDPLFGTGEDTGLADFEVPNRKFNWQTELTLPEKWPVGKDFTMQVAYKSKGGEFPFYQCIDLHSVAAPPTPDPFPYTLVIGIASAVLAVCCIFGFVCLCWIKKKKARREQEYQESWNPKQANLHQGPSNSGTYVYGDVSGLNAKDVSVSISSGKKKHHSRGGSSPSDHRSDQSRTRHQRSENSHRNERHRDHDDMSTSSKHSSSKPESVSSRHSSKHRSRSHREKPAKKGTFDYAGPPEQHDRHYREKQHYKQQKYERRNQPRQQQVEFKGKYASWANGERENNNYAYEPHAIYGPMGKSPSVSRESRGQSPKKSRRSRKERDSPAMRI